MPVYELHFSTVAESKRAGSIHVKGCKHGTPRHVRVIPLIGHVIELAALDEHVLDLKERGYGVRIAPCVRRAAAPCEVIDCRACGGAGYADVAGGPCPACGGSGKDRRPT